MRQDDPAPPGGPPAAESDAEESLLDQVFRMATDGMAIIRLNDRVVLKANAALCRLWDRTLEEVVGQPSWHFSNWLDEEERQSFLRNLREKRELLDYETQLKMADGRRVAVLLSSRLITFGNQPALLSTLRDVTERKRGEILAAQLAAIVESSDDAIVGKDLRGIVTSWHAGAERLFGYTASEMLGQEVTRLLPADRFAEEAGLLARLGRGEKIQHFETVRVRKDGSGVDVSATVSPIRDSVGKGMGGSKVARDLTARKQAAAEIRQLNAGLERRVAERAAELEEANRELRYSRTMLENLFEALPGKYLILDPQFRIITASGAYLKATMTTRAGIVGRGIFEVFPDNPGEHGATGVSNLRSSLNRVREANVTDAMAIQRYDIRRPNGVFEQRYWSPINTPVFGAEHQLEYIIHRVEDVTDFVLQRANSPADSAALRDQLEQMEAEIFQSGQRIQDAKQQLQVANQELEAFSYSVSHDLRAPLRAVTGFAEAVLEDFGPQLPPEGQRQLQIIRESAQRMGELIDDLLKFSQLSRQQLTTKHVQTEELVRMTLEEMGVGLNEPGRHVLLGKLPPCNGDPALLKQVWINLIANALKYSRKRERALIEIGCLAQKGELAYFVRDNGAGFDMRYAGKLFGVFQRLHRAEEFEGTGVGLAIVQRIVRRHGGRIWAEAAVDQGATFFFTLGSPAAA